VPVSRRSTATRRWLLQPPTSWRRSSVPSFGRHWSAPASAVRPSPGRPGGNEEGTSTMKKSLFLNPPSFEGFDGGAGSRYQARREVRSFWYPTWLAQPAALVPDSKLIDAPAAGVSLGAVLQAAKDYELCFIHTSTPSFRADVKTAEAMKDVNPSITMGFVGPHVAVLPEEALKAPKAIAS